VRPPAGLEAVSAVVFAAGFGTRLLPVTRTVPKPLVPILDVPLVDLAVEAVSAVASTIVVNAGHLGDGLADHLRPQAVEVFREGPEPYGNAATLRGVLEHLGDTTITYNCDLVSDLDVRLLVDEHRRAGRLATLACASVDAGADFVMDGGLRLIDRRARSVPGYLFLGAACFERKALAAIPDGRPLGLIEGLIGPLLEQGAIHVHEHAGYARDAGTLGNLLQINLDALGRGLSIASPGRVLPRDGDHAYVGPGAAVADESLGAGAVVGAGATVHPRARIASALIWSAEDVPPVVLHDCIFFGGDVLPVGPR
jgi:NDP-sugar pyrophosphorylase family protein